MSDPALSYNLALTPTETQAPPNGTIFCDPDIYTLYFSFHISQDAAVPSGYLCSPRAILEQYVGSPVEMEAPDWTNWQPDTVHQVIISRAEAARMAFHTATFMPNLLEVCSSLSY